MIIFIVILISSLIFSAVNYILTIKAEINLSKSFERGEIKQYTYDKYLKRYEMLGFISLLPFTIIMVLWFLLCG